MIKWTDLVGIMEQVRESQILHDYTYMWNLKQKQMNKQKLTYKENKWVVTIVETDMKIGEIGEEN